MIDLEALCRDLRDEHQDLDDLVAPLPDAKWDVETPAPGWSVRDQISHLAFFDEQASLAARSPDEFLGSLANITSVESFIDEPLERAREQEPLEVLAWWRIARSEMLDAFARIDAAARIPWFGPPMSPASFISARLMETWAHGQDVVDALGAVRRPTVRLKHVAHLGVRARRNSYVANGRDMPAEEVRVALASPDGGSWSWGDSTTDVIRGEALDFCLVVTQRRHLDDTDLEIDGDLAREWMSIAQAFAGPPGEGRRAGQFPRTRT